MSEQDIIQDLVSKWVSLGLEFAGSAPGISVIYVYVSSERGSIYPEIVFEQNGAIVYPGDVTGTDTSEQRVRSIHRLQFEDLQAAEKRFDEIGVPRPTEYKVYFEPATRKLDVQLSRELIYANDPVKIPEHGIRDWLGERAPQLF
jgi:hypothetical protein